jgi:thiol:disulfide interchange protein DsbD
MKQFLLLVFASLLAGYGQAQPNPVTWSFTSKKVGDKLYEIHMKASIQQKWHLYSQTQPADAIAIPTAFTVTRNPLFTPDGKIKEVGKMEVMRDKTLGVSAHQYSNSVTFVQKIKLKTNARTNFTGTVEYQVCDDEKCLPPKKVNFNVAIQ